MSSGSRFVRDLVRSARADAPVIGARGRARARLGVGDGSSPSPLALGGALLLVAATLATGSYSSRGPAGAGTEVIATECWGGVEAPPCSCRDRSPPHGLSGGLGGSSSGTDFSRSGSGG